MSFAVRAKRQHKTGPTSQELGTEIGSHIYDHIPGLIVDLDHPDYEIFIEVRDFGGLVYDRRIPARAACRGARRDGSSSSSHRVSILPLLRGLR